MFLQLDLPTYLSSNLINEYFRLYQSGVLDLIKFIWILEKVLAAFHPPQKKESWIGRREAVMNPIFEQLYYLTKMSSGILSKVMRYESTSFSWKNMAKLAKLSICQEEITKPPQIVGKEIMH